MEGSYSFSCPQSEGEFIPNSKWLSSKFHVNAQLRSNYVEGVTMFHDQESVYRQLSMYRPLHCQLTLDRVDISASAFHTIIPLEN